jgi:soluble lytic murein transglycosylase-like protein
MYWKLAYENSPYRKLIDRSEAEHKLPPGLLARLLWQESRYNPKASNPSGACGIAQIIPRWHPGVDVWNPQEAIPYAAAYLQNLYGQFKSWKLALAAYNWGPGNLAKFGITTAPDETREYYRSILADVNAENGSAVA